MASSGHIVLTSHSRPGSNHLSPVHWGAEDARTRGPIIASVSNQSHRNAIGTHSGSYSVYRAISVAAGRLDPAHVPDLTNTSPVTKVGPHKQWFDSKKVVSFDPWGHLVVDEFKDHLKEGFDIRPTIAITQARLQLMEIREAMAQGRLQPDGQVLLENGDVNVTKIAIDPVWHIPGLADRFKMDEHTFRRAIFEQTGGMYPELVTRSDLEVFLPPIGGITAYIFGNPDTLSNPEVRLACRVHDECNGSDVFGSDICTCRPYLTHGIEIGVEMAQHGGNGLVVYNRKEGRALGEVTKFLVYNARKRQKGGDSAAKYFERTECVAGVQDARFQELMPDIFHWLGVTRIDRFASMSDMKHDALVNQGIEIIERLDIPDELIPEDAHVEMEAKKAAGYYTSKSSKEGEDLNSVVGRKIEK
ncbi:GTP cyclohydrolase II [Alphaproteobacteria bacterium]|nr:GTP cyclohydrolase II [Alphaproteobacteria bacterium]